MVLGVFAKSGRSTHHRLCHYFESKLFAKLFAVGCHSARFWVLYTAADSMAQAVGRFDALCKLILKFPELASSGKFVFLPGPQDPGAGDTLPRPPVRRVSCSCARGGLSCGGWGGGRMFFGDECCRPGFVRVVAGSAI